MPAPLAEEAQQAGKCLSWLAYEWLVTQQPLRRPPDCRKEGFRREKALHVSVPPRLPAKQAQ
jgi:hypothetical protein